MQQRMLSAHGSLGDHQFGAPPRYWPLLGKTLPYWLDTNNNVSGCKSTLFLISFFPVSGNIDR